LTNEPVVKLDRICKQYGDAIILDNIEFEVTKGEILSLVGPNGSGKSTLLKIISKLIEPDSGVLKLFGEEVPDHDPEVMKKIGVLFDHNAHWDNMTGYENAWFFFRSYGLSKIATKTKLEELLKWAGLWEKKDQAVRTYSYGMRRKLAIIEILAHDPQLLLLDEPAMGLDYSSRLALYGLIDDITKRGKSVIFSTNDVAEAALLAHEVLLLNQGKIIATGTPDALISSLQLSTKIEVKLANPIPLNGIENIENVQGLGIDTTVTDCFKIDILTGSGKTVLPELIRKIFDENGIIQGIEMKQPTLGDVFLKFTGENHAVTS